MNDASKMALQAYETKYGKKPKDAAALVSFVKSNKNLKSITQEQAKAVLDSTTTEKKENKKTASLEKQGTNNKNKIEKKEQALYEVGDKVLMSKDRMGIVRYVGEIPELGTGLWYGVELTDGSIGQSDGTVHGKKYFTTEGKRALFGLASKIRRKMNDKDHKRHDSLMQLQQTKTESPKSDPQQQTFTNKSENEDATDSPLTNNSPLTNSSPLPSNSPLPNSSPLTTSSSLTNNSPLATDLIKVKVKEKVSVSDSLTEQNLDKKQSPVHSVTKDIQVKQKYQEEVTNLKIEKKQSNGSGSEEIRKPIRSSTLKTSTGISCAEPYETLLLFILRQSDELRERLLDIFANPQLHPLLIHSYSELKNMEKEEQEKLWNALFVRWRRFS